MLINYCTADNYQGKIFTDLLEMGSHREDQWLAASSRQTSYLCPVTCALVPRMQTIIGHGCPVRDEDTETQTFTKGTTCIELWDTSCTEELVVVWESISVPLGKGLIHLVYLSALFVRRPGLNTYPSLCAELLKPQKFYILNFTCYTVLHPV